MTPETRQHKNALPVGTRIGDLEIAGMLGFGATGITYRALSLQGREVALKEYFPLGLAAREGDLQVTAISDLLNGDFVQQKSLFLQEAQRLAGIDAPNVVSILDVFEANGTAYFSMSLVEGANLSDRLDAGPVDRAAALSLRDEMLDALESVHAAGVIHRDIKPENIVLDARTGKAVLVDFGAALEPSSALTQAQTRVGTFHYRAPEQMAGSDDVGAWSDIYGLAATLYRAVSGQPPVDASARQVAVLNGKPDPLIDISADERLLARFGVGFLDALMAGLELRLGDRPASVQEWRDRFFGNRADNSPRSQSASKQSMVPTRHLPRPDVGSTRRRETALSSETDALGPIGGYAPEPERQPWGRWIAGLVLIVSIAAGGLWLVMEANTGAVVSDRDAALVAEDSETPAEPPRSSDNEAWVRALEQDTLEGYRAYLEAFPEGRFAAEAQAEIDRYDDAAWAQAEQRNTLAAYEDYLEAWPEGRHASQARERANAIRDAQEAAAADAAERASAEAADWEQAARSNTIDAYQEYLTKHPAGPNAPEARARRDRLQAQAADRGAFQQAAQLNTVRAYEQYLSQFPQGAFQMQAVAAIDALKPAAGRTFRDCPSCPVMVIVPTGTAQLGAADGDPDASPAEGPQRPVVFQGFFAIAETETTFAQWQACVSEGGCSPIANDNGWGRGNRPAINVTWDDASAYAAWLTRKTGETYSLPSEAQWEYAARAISSSPLPA
ncbi:MAG: bifunctional serine/threonine-protein kinase/formylglycine-generating enzyme family protein, partial [Pseudomonadota bacterium]